MQKKKTENARSISKFMQNRAEMQKKRQKMHFNLKIHAKKGKNGKKKTHLFGFFRFYIPCAFFLHFKPKNSYKKRQKCKKKHKSFFKLQK